MARADRLFRLLDALRRLPPPATAALLARETGEARAPFTATSRRSGRAAR